MQQTSLNLNLSIKKTRKREFLQDMDQVVPWAALVQRIAPYYPEGRNGRPPFSLETMLRVHFMQQWFSFSDPGMEEAFFDTPLYSEFAQLQEFARVSMHAMAAQFGDYLLINVRRRHLGYQNRRDWFVFILPQVT